jgi:hypothetical protein
LMPHLIPGLFNPSFRRRSSGASRGLRYTLPSSRPPRPTRFIDPRSILGEPVARYPVVDLQPIFGRRPIDVLQWSFFLVGLRIYSTTPIATRSSVETGHHNLHFRLNGSGGMVFTSPAAALTLRQSQATGQSPVDSLPPGFLQSFTKNQPPSANDLHALPGFA